ncbi:zinc-ribbon domain-containing protein [Paractinoplanes tereljensis]
MCSRPFWWRCAHDHQWQATVPARTRTDDPGCPTC